MRAHTSLVAALLIAAFCTHQASCMYASGGDVVNLTPENFDSKLKLGVWLVEFYAPWCGHCKSLKPAWEQAAKALKGIVNVGAVDADAHGSLGSQYNVQGFPTIKFMYANEKGNVKAVDYQGGRDAAAMINFAMDKARAFALKKIGQKADSGGSQKRASSGSAGSAGGSGFYAGTNVVELSDSDFQQKVSSSDDLWIIEFYAPWCGHCKALKPAWTDAADQLKGKVHVAAVDCTASQETCQSFGVQGYPTIKFFGSNKSSPEEYQGGRDSGSIVSFCSQRWSAQAPPPEVTELTSQDVMAEACTGSSKQLCFLAFLPNILDSGAKGRKKYIATLQKVADKYKDRPFSYLWVEGGAQPSLEENFGVGGFGYPALVAYNPSRSGFSTCREAFEFEHVTSWVERIRRAGETVASIQGELAQVSTRTAWDGKDAKVEVEDEFSLDDIMNEEL